MTELHKVFILHSIAFKYRAQSFNDMIQIYFTRFNKFNVYEKF